MWYPICLWSLMFLPLVQPFQKQNTYHKDFYTNGNIKSEGWLQNGVKTDYWKFYYSNGNISEEGHYQNNHRTDYWYFYTQNGTPLQEGHYKNGKKADWWLFYDTHGRITHKCQLSDGVKNGYCLKYEDEILISAEKYKNGKKIKEWHNFNNFRRENKLSDLH